MEDSTHFIIERDGDYLEHFGIKGMKWKNKKKQREEDEAARAVDRKAMKLVYTGNTKIWEGGAGGDFSPKHRVKQQSGDDQVINGRNRYHEEVTRPYGGTKRELRMTKNKYKTSYDEKKYKPKQHKLSAKDKATRFIKKLFGG